LHRLISKNTATDFANFVNIVDRKQKLQLSELQLDGLYFRNCCTKMGIKLFYLAPLRREKGKVKRGLLNKILPNLAKNSR